MIMKKLTSIRLIKQPKNTPYCGVACINMVLKYYDKTCLKMDDVWNHISSVSPSGRRYCKTYKMGKYLEQNQLVTSVIKFKELDAVLKYCKDNRIPGILNMHSFQNENLGHFILVINYNGKIIIIRDPENENRTIVKYDELERLCIRNNEFDEIGENTIILSSERTGNEEIYSCNKCHASNVIHENLEDMIYGYVCKTCDAFNELGQRISHGN